MQMMAVSVLVASSLVLVEAGPLKVFVLAGQSNMEGQGYILLAYRVRI